MNEISSLGLIDSNFSSKESIEISSLESSFVYGATNILRVKVTKKKPIACGIKNFIKSLRDNPTEKYP